MSGKRKISNVKQQDSATVYRAAPTMEKKSTTVTESAPTHKPTPQKK